MADFYQVDLDVLGRMTKTLQDAGEQMGQALQALAGEQGGSIGPSDLATAAGNFQHTWKYGLGQLQQAIEECTEGVDKVRKNYEDTEQGIAQALGKISNLLQQ
jgi:uncharacterized protein YukE